MPKPKKQHQADPLLEKLDLLDRLEELREDLEEFGISTIEELNQRIAELEAEIEDEEEDAGDDDGPV